MASTVGFLAAAGAAIWFVRLRHAGRLSRKSEGSNGGFPYRSGGIGKTALRVGTRKSDLAMIQTRHAERLIKEKFPEVAVEVLEPISAYGDKKLEASLKTLATKTPGLFTKDLEEGLLNGAYDVAVHSLKDVPTTLPDGLVIAAITEREDPRDALGK